jgi:BlaI family penicillinase repressor
MARSRPGLSRAEWRLMHRCWELGPATAREIHGEVEDDRDYRTIKTFLDRMVVKGFLGVSKEDGVNRYVPVVERERALRDAVEGFVVDILDNAVGPVLSQLVDSRRLTQADLDRLRELLLDDGEGEKP